MNKNIFIIGLLMILSIGLVNALSCSLDTTASSVNVEGYYFGDNTDITVNINVELFSSSGCAYSAIYFNPHGCDCGGNEIQFEVCDDTLNINSDGVPIFNTYPFTSELPMTLIYHLANGTVTLYANGYEQATAPIGSNLDPGYYLTLETSDANVQIVSATSNNCPQAALTTFTKIAEGEGNYQTTPPTPAYANGYVYVGGETGTMYQLTASNVSKDITYPLISYSNTIPIPNMWYPPVYNTHYIYGIDTGKEGNLVVHDTPILFQYTLNGTYITQNNNLSTDYGQYMGVDDNYLYTYDGSCTLNIYDATNISNLLNSIDFCTTYNINPNEMIYANNTLYLGVGKSTWAGNGIIEIKVASRLANPSYIYTGIAPYEFENNLNDGGFIAQTDGLTLANGHIYEIFYDSGSDKFWLYQFNPLDMSTTGSVIIAFNNNYNNGDRYYSKISVGGGSIYIPGQAYYDGDIYGDYPGVPIIPRSAYPPYGECPTCILSNALLKLNENDISSGAGEISNTYMLSTAPNTVVQSTPLYNNGKLYFNDVTKLYQFNANTLALEKTYPINGINVPYNNWANVVQGPIYNSGSIFILSNFIETPATSTIVQLNATDISRKIAYYTWDKYILANPINIGTNVFWSTDASSTGYWFTTCTERWVMTCTAGHEVWTDARQCGTTTNKPADGAPCCTELWSPRYTPPTCSGVTSQVKYYVDLGYCGTYNSLPADNGTTIACGSAHSYANVLGWDLLMSGQPGLAAFTALNVPLGGWLIFIFWFIISWVIISKTGSWEISTIVGLIFLALFLTTPWFTGWQIGGAILWMVFQVGIVFFRMAAKEKNL